jgi:GT2 family glycosyltransferase
MVLIGLRDDSVEGQGAGGIWDVGADVFATETSTSAATYDVIVTDDGQSSSAQAMIKDRFPWVRWTEGPRRGPAANRNHGASLAKGDWLVFTDDDCIPEAGWLHAFSRSSIAYPDVPVFEGSTAAKGVKQYLNEAAPINDSGGFLWSCNMAIRRAVFMQNRGFDEDFPFAAMEDVDFQRRLQAQSIESLFIREARVFHPWKRMTSCNSISRYSRSLTIFLSKHPKECRWYHAVCHVRFAWNGIRELTVALLSGRWQGVGFHICQHATYLMIAVRLFVSHFLVRVRAMEIFK